MRRPPDKDAHSGVSDRDIESSNATLNTLFGGARQKSWMVGGGSAVRPTPRTGTSRPSFPQLSLAPRPMAVLPSPTPSNEILSQTPIGNGAHNENPSPITNSENVPSRINIQSSVVEQNRGAASHNSNAPQVAARGLATPSPAVQIQPLPNVQNLVNSQVLRSPDIIPATLPSHLPSALARNNTLTSGREQTHSPSTELGQERSRSASQRPLSAQTSTVSASTPPFYAQAPNQGQNQRQGPQNSRPSPIRVDSRSPAVSVTALPSPPVQNQATQKGLPAPSNPHKRLRTQISAMPLLKPRIVLINAHISSVGGAENLNNALERPRFQLLTDACNTEDAFYVALHQLFCTWDYDPSEVLTIGLLPAANILTIAFKILGQLIRDNEGLTPNHLKWFAHFPSPISDLVISSEPYRRTVSDVGIFLGRLASDWAALSRQCTGRGYPPLVDEMVNRMGLLSPILQQVVFTATRRNLGVPDNVYGHEMERLFAQDRKGQREMAARYNSPHPPTEQEVHKRNQDLVDGYIFQFNHYQMQLQAQNQQRQQRRPSGPAAGSPLAQPPIVPSNAQNQASRSNSGTSASSNRPSVAQNQNAQIQATPNPEQWQYNPQMHPTQAVTTGSPNLTLTSSRPPSVMSQQLNTDTPSPTFMQSLSMQSPAMQSTAMHSPGQQQFQWSSPTQRNNSIPGQLGQPNQTPLILNGNQNVAPSPNTSWVQSPQRGPATQTQLVHQQQATNQQQRQVQQLQAQQLQAGQHQQWQQIMPPVAVQRLIHQQQQAAQNQVLSMNRAAQLQNNSVPSSENRHPRPSNVRASSRNIPIPQSSTVNPLMPVLVVHKDPRQAQLEYNQAVLTHSIERPLAPPEGYVHPTAPTEPDLTALHQAHVRSPRLLPVDFESSEGPEDDPSRRHYQAVQGFALDPTKIPQTGNLSKFEFTVSQEAYSLIAQDKWPTTDRLANRMFRQGTLQYRLRCIQTKKEVTKCLEPDWIISDTVWPESIFMEINNQVLEVRRKNHHGKDLPIDITRGIISPVTYPGSKNRITISIPRSTRKLNDAHWYFIAVEVIEILKHDQIMEMCKQFQRIPASQTSDSIKRSLAPLSDDDDDLAMIVSDLSVDLADPFTAQIFEIPVRGSSCLHRECFDLETFLLTRTSKPKRPPFTPSMIDVWKCPLCGKDARPYSLRIDDFLASIRAELAKQDNLHVKAILISADGSWRPKPEPQPLKRKATNGLDEDDSSDNEDLAKDKLMANVRRQGSAHTNGSSRRESSAVEVIELE